VSTCPSDVLDIDMPIGSPGVHASISTVTMLQQQGYNQATQLQCADCVPPLCITAEGLSDPDSPHSHPSQHTSQPGKLSTTQHATWHAHTSKRGSNIWYSKPCASTLGCTNTAPGLGTDTRNMNETRQHAQDNQGRLPDFQCCAETQPLLRGAVSSWLGRPAVLQHALRQTTHAEASNHHEPASIAPVNAAATLVYDAMAAWRTHL
jgi:hypothetical protein